MADPFEFLKAIGASTLPPEIRHFVNVLVILADAKTASAYPSQGTIAQFVGVTPRQVRRYFDEVDRLVSLGKCPVRVVRERRGRVGGTGRSSDRYALELAFAPTPATASAELNRTPATASAELNRTPATASAELNRTPATAQPDTGDTSTGHPCPGIGDLSAIRIGDRSIDHVNPLDSDAPMPCPADLYVRLVGDGSAARWADTLEAAPWDVSACLKEFRDFWVLEQRPFPQWRKKALWWVRKKQKDGDLAGMGESPGAAAHRERTGADLRDAEKPGASRCRLPPAKVKTEPVMLASTAEIDKYRVEVLGDRRSAGAK